MSREEIKEEYKNAFEKAKEAIEMQRSIIEEQRGIIKSQEKLIDKWKRCADPEKYGEYSLGEALADLYSSLPPHPDVRR